MNYSTLIENHLLYYMQSEVDDDAPEDIVVGHIRGLQHAIDILKGVEDKQRKGLKNEQH